MECKKTQVQWKTTMQVNCCWISSSRDNNKTKLVNWCLTSSSSKLRVIVTSNNLNSNNHKTSLWTSSNFKNQWLLTNMHSITLKMQVSQKTTFPKQQMNASMMIKLSNKTSQISFSSQWIPNLHLNKLHFPNQTNKLIVSKTCLHIKKNNFCFSNCNSKTRKFNPKHINKCFNNNCTHITNSNNNCFNNKTIPTITTQTSFITNKCKWTILCFGSKTWRCWLSK